MNIRKQNNDEHTVVGYASVCACAMARATCGCSIQKCYCICVSPSDTIDITASVTQSAYTATNNPLRDQASNSAQAKMIH